jgi:glycolate oxidase FAD binding subunit
VRGGGTKSGGDTGATLSLRGLSGIVDYTPDECVLTAMAGTPLADIEAALAANRQYLPFDPPLASHGATIGGTVAAGASGPLRYRYGGVRDFVIGVRVIDGEGRSIRSGGKVVKNAAGFLLHHAMVGSQGAFGVLSEITLKVFPRPSARATIKVDCGRVDEAAAAARTLEAKRFDLEAVDFSGEGTLWIRVAGCAAAIGERAARIREVLGGSMLNDTEEQALWARARDFAWADVSHAIVKIPLSGPSASNVQAVATAIGIPIVAPAAGELQRLWYSCGGRCAFAAVEDTAALATGLAAARLRGVIVRGSGAGTMIGAVERNVFEERVRRVLDPHNRFRAASDPA